jgi:bifunctional enzyme CysN/CysC
VLAADQKPKAQADATNRVDDARLPLQAGEKTGRLQLMATPGFTGHLARAPRKDTLRFMTCGSVDDGKSTLIGRLLRDLHAIRDDQQVALQTDSRQFGTQGNAIDYALLCDGLLAEREQGITIDVAYRYFATARRRFIVADTPGHEQYTRNMATAASNAALAVLLLDATKGMLTQTRRHSRILAMMGVRHVLLAVNKMDLAGYAQPVFDDLVSEYRQFAAALGFVSVQAMPLSALKGDNFLVRSGHTSWYQGPTLLDYLENIRLVEDSAAEAFRMPVQWVNRSHAALRGYCGTLAAGELHAGDRIRVMPSGVETRVREITLGVTVCTAASTGDAVMVTLSDEVDVGRGDVLVAADQVPEVADQFEARLIWMAMQPLLPGRSYLMKLHTREVPATVTAIKYREDVNTGARLAAKALAMNEIATVTLSTRQPVVFEPYTVNRTLGGFILIDRLSFETVGGGMLNFALRRASNLHRQTLDVTQVTRATLMQQRPRCIWFTGLSGAGKSTLANLLEKRLHAEGRHTYLLDGDNVRHGLNRDLGFTEADRVENIRRVAEVARLMVDAGLIVLVSLISPYRAERRMARELFAPEEFLEVFVDAPLAECERRDPKGLYAKARRGELTNFTGIDSVYEAPHAPDIHLRTGEESAAVCVGRLLKGICEIMPS